MDARRRVNVEAGNKAANAQRLETEKNYPSLNSKAPKYVTNEKPIKKGQFNHEVTAFGKTYHINDNGELVK